MRSVRALFVAALLTAITMAVSVPTMAVQTANPSVASASLLGKPCPRLGEQRWVGKTLYGCVKRGNKLKWTIYSTKPLSSTDKAWIKKVAGWIIDDIRTVDEYMLDGIMVSSALWMLADNYDRLLDSPVPPGLDIIDYKARLSTLSKFADLAGDEYFDYPIQASARYEVLRKETAPVLQAINWSLKTNFRLPPR